MEDRDGGLGFGWVGLRWVWGGGAKWALGEVMQLSDRAMRAGIQLACVPNIGEAVLGLEVGCISTRMLEGYLVHASWPLSLPSGRLSPSAWRANVMRASFLHQDMERSKILGHRSSRFVAESKQVCCQRFSVETQERQPAIETVP